MSAPRPYETDPLRPPSSVHVLYWYQFLYICQRFSSDFIHVVIALRLGTMQICHLRMRSSRITYSGASLLGVMRNEMSKILNMNLNRLNEY